MWMKSGHVARNLINPVCGIKVQSPKTSNRKERKRDQSIRARVHNRRRVI